MRIVALIFMLLAAVSTWCQDVSFSVQAPAQAIQGQRFTVTYRLVNADVQVHTGPQLKGCKLLYGPGVSTMVSSTFNGRQQTQRVVQEYTFTYLAESAGTVTVPAMSLNISGTTYKSKPCNITILPSNSPQRGQGNAGAAAPQQQSGTVAKIQPSDLIVTVTMSKDKVYVQEAVIATIKVYTKYNILSFRATTLPTFDGFLSEELPVNEQPKLEHFRGSNYYSAVLKRCLLFPQKEGKLTINSGSYDVTLETYEEISNGYFITRRPIEKNITTKSNSLSVNVTPLPQPAPVGFNGAVGTNFSVSTSLEPSVLHTNEAATYKFQVKGTGNIKYLTAPDIDFGSGVDEFEPETESDASFNGTTNTGTYTISYTIEPQQVGTLEIAQRNFVYFNPLTGKYITVEVPGISRKVARGLSAPASSGNTSVIKGPEDILHIKTIHLSDLEKEPQRTFYTVIYILCYIVAAFLLVMAALIYRRSIKLNADVAGRRTAKASKLAHKRLRNARIQMDRHNNEEFYSVLAAAMWGYLGDKLHIASSALTRENISEKLTRYGASPELVSKTIQVLDDCEMARFTPNHSDTEVSQLYNSAVEVINSLESTKGTLKNN